MLLEDELVTEEHHAKSLLQVVPPVVAFDFESDSDPAVHVAVAAGSEDGVITNLCRIPRHSHSDTTMEMDMDINMGTDNNPNPAAVHQSNSGGHTTESEWTYDYAAVAAKDDNENDNENDNNDAQFAMEVDILRDRPGYRNDNDTADGANEYDDDENDDHDDGDDDDDDDGNMLPSRAELAAEERMLWRMADTPIPTEPG
jgi:hypothetical protein